MFPNNELIESIFSYDVLDNPISIEVQIDANTTKSSITTYNAD
jgi:hypothetical protein